MEVGLAFVLDLRLLVAECESAGLARPVAWLTPGVACKALSAVWMRWVVMTIGMGQSRVEVVLAHLESALWSDRIVITVFHKT
jgi:hypothetical protein